MASIALDNARLYATAQQELVERQKAERRYRTLVEQIPVMVYSEEFADRRAPPVRQPPGTSR